MIFKTFQSDLDGISNKIGFSKRSFAEWGKQVSASFKESEGGINSFKKALKTAFSVPIKKDNSWIKNEFGEIVDKENIDSYIPQLVKEDASNLAQKIREQSIAVANAKDGWEDYFAQLKGKNQGYIIDLIKNTDDLSKLTGEDLVKANQQARASALAHNEVIKAQTLSAKAGTVALKALSIAGNMIAMWAISKGLELAVKGIDELAHSAEHCAERVDDLMSNYKSTTSTLHDNAKAISELSDRYDKLSKGVGKLGNNISLTEEEFEEYHSITSKIAEMYPDLVDGWDAQGNAIVNLTDSVKELNAEYDKSLHNANLTLMESKDDIFKNYENTINDITKDIEYAEKAMDIIQSGGSFYDVIYDAEGYKTSYYKAFENLGLSIDDMVNNNFNTLEKQITLKIQALKDEMEKAAQDVTPLLNAYLAEDTDYQNLSDEGLKTALSTFINSLPSSLVSDITENGASAGSNFVEGLVDSVKDDEIAQNALKQLLTIDLDELSYEEAKSLIDNYISVLVNTLNSVGYEIDPIELHVDLGLDIPNVKEDLRNRLSNGTQDLVIDDWVENLTEEETKLANSTAFDEALDRQKEKLNGASLSAENYGTALEEVKAQQNGIGTDDSIIPTISSSIKQIATQLEPQFAKLGEAYQEIFKLDDNGKKKFSLDSIDNSMLEELRQTFAEIKKDVGVTFDASKLDSFFDTLTSGNATAEQVQQAFNDLATAYLYSTDTLEQLNSETADSIEKQLEAMGVQNAAEIVAEALTAKTEELIVAKEYLAQTGKDLASATEEERTAFILEQIEAGNCGEALALLQLKKLLVNQSTITTADDCQNILDLATAANIGIIKLQQLQTLMDMITQRDSAVQRGDSRAVSELNRAIREFSDNVINNLNLEDIEVDFSGAEKSAGKAGKKAGDAYVDAFEEELKDLQDLRDRGVIDEAEYLRRLRELYTRYFADRKEYLSEFRKYERQYLEGRHTCPLLQ